MISLILLVVASIVLYKLVDIAIRSLKIDGLSSKAVLITGCDSGFGHALALHLDSLGFTVFAGCLSDDGQKLLTNSASTRLTPFTLDVTQPESIQNGLDLVKGKLIRDDGLWAIVNNAGVTGTLGPVELCTQKDFHRDTAVNLFGPIEMCRAFLPLVRKSKGRIVNMSSAMGRIVGEAPPYAVSKFGIEAVSDGLRRDLYNTGVKVSILEPGFFRTRVVHKDNMDNALVKAFDNVDDEIKDAYGGQKFIKRRLKLMSGTRRLASRDLSPVVNAYTHAIVSRFPRSRYIVGWDAKLVFVPLSMIPTGIADWLITGWIGG